MKEKQKDIPYGSHEKHADSRHDLSQDTVLDRLENVCRKTHQSSDDASGHPILEEVNICQVQLAHIVLLSSTANNHSWYMKTRIGDYRIHSRRLIREAGHRHTHTTGADESSEEDEQVLIISRHFAAHFASDGYKENTGYSMTYKGRHNLGDE